MYAGGMTVYAVLITATHEFPCAMSVIHTNETYWQASKVAMPLAASKMARPLSISA